MRKLNLVKGRGLRHDDYNVIILEMKMARKYGFNIGDKIELESRGNHKEARLIGVFSGDLPGSSYVPYLFGQDLLDLNERATGLFLKTAISEDKLQKKLYAIGDVGNVTYKDTVINDLLDATREVGIIINISAVFSIAVASLFIYTSIAFTIFQRRAEYGMFRILGFDNRTITYMILTEIIVLGAAAALIAVAVSMGLSNYLNERLSAAWFNVNMHTRIRDFLFILIPAMVFLPMAAIPSVRMVLRYPVVRTLRERRFG
jgi:ABC-type antimicrobial peptide transport system permease subunit